MHQKNLLNEPIEYREDFFELVSAGSLSSAQVILPIIIDLIQPRSVIDVGCGQGLWLSTLAKFGIEDILGLDGDYIDNNSLKIPKNKFKSQNLTQPFKLNRSFDLVISLEVAEHLPEKFANSFVESLTNLGKVVLFSAAIPYQAGIGHVNEQWQDYWAEKFQHRGYVTIDCVRPKVWNNSQVDFWYAQNTLVFAAQDSLKNYPKLKAESEKMHLSSLSVVHPQKYWEKQQENQQLIQTVEYYKHASNPQNWSLKEILAVIPTVVVNGFKRTLENWISSKRFSTSKK